MTNGFTKFVENNFKLAINDKEFLMIFIVDFIVFNNNFQQLFQKPLPFFVELIVEFIDFDSGKLYRYSICNHGL